MVFADETKQKNNYRNVNITLYLSAYTWKQTRISASFPVSSMEKLITMFCLLQKPINTNVNERKRII